MNKQVLIGMKSNMHTVIMRRVYYSYALGIVSHSMFWQGIFLGVSAWLLAKWLHVASIINNFLSVPVGGAPQYVWNSFWEAITHGELLTAFVLVAAGGVAVSVGYQLTQVLMSRLVELKTV